MKLMPLWGMILASSLAAAQGGNRLTIEDAIRIGREQNRLLKISTVRVEAATAKESEARAALLPSLMFEGSYGRLSDVDPFQIMVPAFPQPITIAPAVLDNYAIRFTLRQPIFTGFRLQSNARAAGYLARASEAENENDRSDLKLTITTAYWTMYLAIEVKKFADENVARLLSYQRDTENLLKAGMADAKNDAEVAAMNLNIVINNPLDSSIELASSPGDTSERPVEGSPDNLTRKALEARADLQAMQARLQASEAAVSAADGSHWPQVFLSGNFYYNRPNLRYQPTRNEFKSTWDVGVAVEFDLWNWGATSSRAGEARAAATQTRLLYEQMKDNIGLEIRRNYLAAERGREKVKIATLAIDQAEENARTTRDKFRNGLATSTDLVDAGAAVLQARTNFAAALVDRELANARLEKSVGELR
ncbi:MAG: TolC family protein [Ignavibacteria bacterium]|nr:MAG: TolC family protein [Ignavibacteria bacterium]